MLTEVNGLRVIDEESPMRKLVFGNLICFVTFAKATHITLVHGREYMITYIVINSLEVSHNALNNRVKII